MPKAEKKYKSTDEFIEELKRKGDIDTSKMQLKTQIVKKGLNGVSGFNYLETPFGKVVIKNEQEASKIEKAIEDVKKIKYLENKIKGLIDNYSYIEMILKKAGIEKNKAGNIDWDKADIDKLNKLINKYAKWYALRELVYIDPNAIKEFGYDLPELSDEDLERLAKSKSIWNLEANFWCDNMAGAIAKIIKDALKKYKVDYVDYYKDGYLKSIGFYDPKTKKGFYISIRNPAVALALSHYGIDDRYIKSNAKKGYEDEWYSHNYANPDKYKYEMRRKFLKNELEKLKKQGIKITYDELYDLYFGKDEAKKLKIQKKILEQQGYTVPDDYNKFLNKILKEGVKEKIIDYRTGDIIIKTSKGTYKLKNVNLKVTDENNKGREISLWNFIKENERRYEQYLHNKKLFDLVKGASEIELMNDREIRVKYKNGKEQYILSDTLTQAAKNLKESFESIGVKLDKKALATYMNNPYKALEDWKKYYEKYYNNQQNLFASGVFVNKQNIVNIKPQIITLPSKVKFEPIVSTRREEKREVKMEVRELHPEFQFQLPQEEYKKYEESYKYYSKLKKGTINPISLANKPLYERLAIQDAIAKGQLKLYDEEGNELMILNKNDGTVIVQSPKYIKIFKNGILTDMYVIKDHKLYKDGREIADLWENDQIEIEGIPFFKGIKDSSMKQPLEHEFEVIYNGQPIKFKMDGTLEWGVVKNEKNQGIGEYKLVKDADGKYKLVLSFSDPRGIHGYAKFNIDDNKVEDLHYETTDEVGRKFVYDINKNGDKLVRVDDQSTNPIINFVHGVASAIPLIGFHEDEIKYWADPKYEAKRFEELKKAVLNAPILNMVWKGYAWGEDITSRLVSGKEVFGANEGERVKEIFKKIDEGKTAPLLAQALIGWLWGIDVTYRDALRLGAEVSKAIRNVQKAGLTAYDVVTDKIIDTLKPMIKDKKTIELMKSTKDTAKTVLSFTPLFNMANYTDDDIYKAWAVVGTGLNLLGAYALAKDIANALPQLAKEGINISKSVPKTVGKISRTTANRVKSMAKNVSKIKDFKLPTPQEVKNICLEFANKIKKFAETEIPKIKETIRPSQKTIAKKVAKELEIKPRVTEKLTTEIKSANELNKIKAKIDNLISSFRIRALSDIAKIDFSNPKLKKMWTTELMWKEIPTTGEVAPMIKKTIGNYTLILDERFPLYVLEKIKTSNWYDKWVNTPLSSITKYSREILSNLFGDAKVEFIAKEYHGEPFDVVPILKGNKLIKAYYYADYVAPGKIKGAVVQIMDEAEKPDKLIRWNFLRIGDLPITLETIVDLKNWKKIAEAIYIDWNTKVQSIPKLIGSVVKEMKNILQPGKPAEVIKSVEHPAGYRITLMKSYEPGKPNKYAIVFQSGNKKFIDVVEPNEVDKWLDLLKAIEKNPKMLREEFFKGVQKYLLHPANRQKVINIASKLAKSLTPAIRRRISRIVKMAMETDQIPIQDISKVKQRLETYIALYPKSMWEEVLSSLENAVRRKLFKNRYEEIKTYVIRRLYNRLIENSVPEIDWEKIAPALVKEGEGEKVSIKFKNKNVAKDIVEPLFKKIDKVETKKIVKAEDILRKEPKVKRGVVIKHKVEIEHPPKNFIDKLDEFITNTYVEANNQYVLARNKLYQLLDKTTADFYSKLFEITMRENKSKRILRTINNIVDKVINKIKEKGIIESDYAKSVRLRKQFRKDILGANKQLSNIEMRDGIHLATGELWQELQQAGEKLATVYEKEADDLLEYASKFIPTYEEYIASLKSITKPKEFINPINIVKDMLAFTKETINALKTIPKLRYLGVPLDRISSIFLKMNAVNNWAGWFAIKDPGSRPYIVKNMKDMINKLTEEIKKKIKDSRWRRFFDTKIKELKAKVETSVNPAEIWNTLMDLQKTYLQIKAIEESTTTTSQKTRDAITQKQTMPQIRDTTAGTQLQFDVPHIDVGIPYAKPPMEVFSPDFNPSYPYISTPNSLEFYGKNYLIFWKEIFKGLTL